MTVHVRYKDVEETFTGDVNEVWMSVNRFFSQIVPAFNAVQGVVLNVDLSEVIDASKGLIAVGEDGSVVLIDRRRLTDSESLLLRLLSAWIGGRLGILERLWLSREELRSWLGKSGKVIGTRLGELVRRGLVVKMEEGNYRLSVFGVRRLVEEVLPRVRRKAQ